MEQGNPPDAPQLVKKRAGRTPRIVTAARGYGEAEVDRQLTDLGITNVVIPRKARPTQARRARGTRPRVRARSAPDPFAEYVEYGRLRLAADPHLWATT